MAQAFEAMAASLEPGGLSGVVFAHADPNAWVTLIEGLLRARLVPDATWPIDTEIQAGLKVIGQARLRTSVWMTCRKREETASEGFLGDVLEEMRPVIRERLLFFWSHGIRGADFFISAIGPALSVFGRHRRVLQPDGTEVSVRDFLDIVRRESTTVALEQVLRGAGPRRGRPAHAPVRDLGVELLSCISRLRRGTCAVPRHRRPVRRPNSRAFHRRDRPREEHQGLSSSARSRSASVRARSSESARPRVPLHSSTSSNAPPGSGGTMKPSASVSTEAPSASRAGRLCSRSAKRSRSAYPRATRTAALFSDCSERPCAALSRSRRPLNSPSRWRTTMAQTNYAALGQGLDIYRGAMRALIHQRLAKALPNGVVGAGCPAGRLAPSI